jgi:hypothetical protein
LLLLGDYAPQVDTSAKLAIKVYPSVSFAPAAILVNVHVPTDSENRALELIADSADYYRSSTIELDGPHAPQTSVFQWRDLPSGEYEVTARLYGRSARVRAQVGQRIAVLERGL